MGDLTLQPDAPNRIPATEREFIVTFTNQGENDETDVQVVLRIEGAGEPIRVVRAGRVRAPGHAGARRRWRSPRRRRSTSP